MVNLRSASVPYKTMTRDAESAGRTYARRQGHCAHATWQVAACPPRLSGAPRPV